MAPGPETSSKQPEARTTAHSTSDNGNTDLRQLPSPTSSSPYSNVGPGIRADTHNIQSPTSLLLNVLGLEYLRPGRDAETRINDGVESPGSDSSGSVYTPQYDMTSLAPYFSPSHSADATQYKLAEQESAIPPQERSLVDERSPGQERVEGQRDTNPDYSKHVGAQVSIPSAFKSDADSSKQPTLPRELTNLSRSNAEIQGAAALMNLNRAASLASSATTANPILKQPLPTNNFPSYIFRRGSRELFGQEHINPVSVPESNRIISSTRNRGNTYRLQEGGITSPAGRPPGYIWPRDNSYFSNQLPQQERFIFANSGSPCIPTGESWYPTSTAVPPYLRFHTNTHDGRRSSIGLVRAPIGSNSRLGTSQWQLAAPGEVPDYIISGTVADRQLNIFYVTNADGTFPDGSRPRPSPLLQAPYTVVGASSHNLAPEKDSSDVQMGAEDKEDAVVETGPSTIVIDKDLPHRITTSGDLSRTTIVIDDDPPLRERPIMARPRTVKWPQDVGIFGFFIQY